MAIETATQASPAARAAPACKGSENTTEGIRVWVQPAFLAHNSDAAARQFVFTYCIRITNESGRTVRLLTRAWHIVDAVGRINEVVGEGVIGQQPILKPGQSFEYSSLCNLATPWGTMEGTYGFAADADERFEARIKRFYLVAGDTKSA
ncbi:Co2+/Mg2+ efflux protein ApaG [soil metagenome]